MLEEDKTNVKWMRIIKDIQIVYCFYTADTKKVC